MRPVMVLGCTSDAGKSFLSAALCRWFARKGERVAPFKAQNMSNNAAVCPDGSEIGRAQFLQAQAAGVVPDARMNPVLLKPEADTHSQVVVMGRYSPLLTRTPWLERREKLWPVICSAYDSLAADFGRVVIEGAGSPAEPNLMAYDLVNLAVARYTGAACYLVADIDRGGAFAHLLGTWQTLEPADRPLIRGFVLNKFRGDPELLLDAREWLLERTGVPTVALVTYRRHLLPEEDNFFHRAPAASKGHVRIGLLLYPWASNLDDFDPLAHQEGVDVIPVRTAEDLEALDALLLPGSKNTAGSLSFLREQGFAALLTAMAASGLPVYGICGGLQMLGRTIADPEGMEGPAGSSVPGLGLLDVETTFATEKITRQTRVSCFDGGSVEGYEIHVGQTCAGPSAKPHLAEGLGFRQGNVTGVYLHGIFTNDHYRYRFLEALGWTGGHEAWKTRIEAELDTVADLVDESGWAKDLVKLG